MNQDAALDQGLHKINAPISMMIAVLFIPIFDTARIIVVRLVKRKSPFEPDNNHTHHVLMRLGLKHSQVALVLGGLNLAFIALVFVFKEQEDYVLLPIMILSGFAISVTIDQLIINKVRTRGGRMRRRLKAEIEAKNSQNKQVGW